MSRVGLNGYIEGEKKVMSSTSAIRRLFLSQQATGKVNPTVAQ